MTQVYNTPQTRAKGAPGLGDPMYTDRTATDRLIIKLFYTACSVFGGVFLWVIIGLTDPRHLGDPSVLVVLGFAAAAVIVLYSVWMQPRRRGRPRPATLLALRWLAGRLAAVLMVWATLILPANALVADSGLTEALIAWGVTLAAAAAIVFLTWDIAVYHDLPGDGLAQSGEELIAADEE